MNIGKVIKELRLVKGFSQSEFAQKCSMTQASVSNIENNIKRPNKITMNKICKQLQVSEMMLYLLGMEYSEVPETKKQSYKILFPIIKTALMQIINE